ncbi:MAG: hypothetical protein ACXWPM_11845 [Bdellovibrionota bacterium]
MYSLLAVKRFEGGIRYQLRHTTASALLTSRAIHAKSAVRSDPFFRTFFTGP